VAVETAGCCDWLAGVVARDGRDYDQEPGKLTAEGRADPMTGMRPRAEICEIVFAGVIWRLRSIGVASIWLFELPAKVLEI
jgi:hypothetical protein